MAEDAILFYHKQFLEVEDHTDFSLLDHVPTMISVDTNDQLCKNRNMMKIKKVIFR